MKNETIFAHSNSSSNTKSLILKKGNIIDSKADVIVTSPGVILNCILHIAGDDIQKELNSNNSKSKNYTDLVITSAGGLKNVKKLYHTACPHFNQKNNNYDFYKNVIIVIGFFFENFIPLFF
jgi:hypothetical protein